MPNFGLTFRGQAAKIHPIFNRIYEMSRICQLSGARPVSVHKVSHSEVKTKRVFRPNLQDCSFFSEILDANVRLRVCSRAIKTIDKNGGIDAYLLGRGNSKLSDDARRVKVRVLGAKAKKGA